MSDGGQQQGLFKKIIGLGFVALLACSSLLVLGKMLFSDPGVPFLSDAHRARWIRVDVPINLGVWKDEFTTAFFKTSFSTAYPPPIEAPLTFRAMKLAEVYLDGRLIMPLQQEYDTWKKERVVNLGPFLAEGEHELLIRVVNRYGPPLLIAHSEALSVYTDKDWDASLDASTWQPSSPATRKEHPELSRRFPSTGEALQGLLPLMLPLFALVFLLALIPRSPSALNGWLHDSILLPSRVRWVLAGLWAALAVNNIAKIPLDVGYDAAYHYEYISYIVNNHRVPLASEGWQMFQPPLYYALSAGLSSVLSLFSLRGDASDMLMRIIPLTCGVLQVEVAYRVMKRVYPTRADLQVLGILFAGLLPMNIYISQFAGNEPLAGLLSAVVVLMSLRVLQNGEPPLPKWYLPVLGLALGSSLLAKATPVLLCPPLAVFLIQSMRRRRLRRRSIAYNLVLVFGIACMVCGWYYVRNWVEFGKPFVGGWDQTRGIGWWQDPGYRTLGDLTAFGRSLTYPIYSAFNGFWDAVYSTFWLDGYLSSMITFEDRPPWNYDPMISGALLSVLLSVGIVLGIARTLAGDTKARQAKLFSVTCIGMYGAALLYLYLTLPIYATAKATYTLGITPCYAVACVSGLDLMMRNKYATAFVYAMITCWGGIAYISYFVL